MLPKQQFHRIPIENSLSPGFASLSGNSFATARVNSDKAATVNRSVPLIGRSHIKYSLAPTRGSDEDSESDIESEVEETAPANARASHSVWDVAWSLQPARRSLSRSARSVSRSSTARVAPNAHSELSTADDSGFVPDSESRTPCSAPALAMQQNSVANPNYPYPRQQPPIDYSVNGNGNSNGNGASSRFATNAESRPVSARLTNARRKARAVGRRLKRWETFPGRNRFCCDARLMQSKKPGAFYITLSLVVIISALYFGFECAPVSL